MQNLGMGNKSVLSGDKSASDIAKPTLRGSDLYANNQFNTRLAEQGATREQIKQINGYVTDLVKHADIKQEDMSDKFSLLKKVEIKLHTLYQLRQVYEFYDQGGMKDLEKTILSKTAKTIKENSKAEAARLQDERNEERARLIKARLDKPKAFGKIDMMRSEKSPPKTNVRKRIDVPEEVQLQRRFLDLVTDDHPEFMNDNYGGKGGAAQN